MPACNCSNMFHNTKTLRFIVNYQNYSLVEPAYFPGVSALDCACTHSIFLYSLIAIVAAADYTSPDYSHANPGSNQDGSQAKSDAAFFLPVRTCIPSCIGCDLFLSVYLTCFFQHLQYLYYLAYSAPIASAYIIKTNSPFQKKTTTKYKLLTGFSPAKNPYLLVVDIL